MSDKLFVYQVRNVLVLSDSTIGMYRYTFVKTGSNKYLVRLDIFGKWEITDYD